MICQTLYINLVIYSKAVVEFGLQDVSFNGLMPLNWELHSHPDMNAVKKSISYLALFILKNILNPKL